MRCNMQLVTVNLEGCFSFSWTSSLGGGRLHWPSGLLPWNMNQWSSHLRQCSVPDCHKSPPNLWVLGFSQSGKHLKKQTNIYIYIYMYVLWKPLPELYVMVCNNGCPPPPCSEETTLYVIHTAGFGHQHACELHFVSITYSRSWLTVPGESTQLWQPAIIHCCAPVKCFQLNVMSGNLPKIEAAGGYKRGGRLSQTRWPSTDAESFALWCNNTWFQVQIIDW